MTMMMAAAVGCMLLQTVTGSTANTVRLAEGAQPPAAKITDVAWLAGAWAGEGLGGSVDAAWSAPGGNAMTGYFRLIRNGKPAFYQILTILESEGSLELRLKHMNADMTAWEEKNAYVSFKLAKIEPGAVYFSGLTFMRPNADRIDGFIAMRDRAAGTLRQEQFTYRRIR